MKHKVKLIIAIFIALLPLNFLRILLYQVLFKYKIKNSKIGWLSILNIESLEIENASISGFNFFTGPFNLKMESASNIGSFNHFKCGQWAKNKPRKRGLILKEESLITNHHLFDLFGNIEIGKKTFIAGAQSQFWTHGGMSNEIDILIGDNCYIGSAVKFIPGSGLNDNSLCAIGSVVTKTFKEKNILIAGVPAKSIKNNVNWRENWK